MNQTTYRGWPLYYFQGDTNLGDVNGENVNKNWFVVKPDETLMIAQRPTLGLFLVDKMGNTLYYFAKDTPGSSAVRGHVLKNGLHSAPDSSVFHRYWIQLDSAL